MITFRKNNKPVFMFYNIYGLVEYFIIFPE